MALDLNSLWQSAHTAAGPAAGSEDPSTAAGGAASVLILYLLFAGTLAYLRNPLRGPHWIKRHRLRRRARNPPAGLTVRDVSAAAWRGRLVAVTRFVVQVTGLIFAAIGAGMFAVRRSDPDARFWYVYLLAGLAAAWAGGRFIRPPGVAGGSHLWRIAGPRKMRVLGMRLLGSVMIVIGTFYVIVYGLDVADPGNPNETAQQQSVRETGMLFISLTGMALLALGAVSYRRARRLGARDARELLHADSRPPILYLRSFGDDRLRLWTATLGRQSFIERLSPRRFDAFEEVLARHLSVLGPVIAVNPPDTALPPLGASRTTLDPDNWQSAVADLMERAARIVLVVPPAAMSPGLRWELLTVSAHDYWDKTLIVVPPLRPRALLDRWESFGEPDGERAVPWPRHEPDTLLLARDRGQWTAFVANHRSEWSYGAALNTARTSDPPP